MTVSLKRILLGAMIAAALLALSMTPTLADDATPAASEPTPDTPPETPAEPEPEPDPYAVPEGTPEELLKYLDELAAYRPPVRSYAEFMLAQQKKAQSMAEATGRILVAEAKLDEDQAAKVISLHISSLASIAESGDKKAAEKLAALPEMLKKIGQESFIRLVQAKLLELKVDTLRAADKPAEAIAELLDEIKTFVKESDGDITRAELNLAYSVSRASTGIAAAVDDPKLAVNAHKTLGQMLIDTGNEQAADLGGKLLGAARRLDLPGNPIIINGFMLDGLAFDMQSLKGKTVLVDFWATWCGPCLAEIPNMTAMYDAYKDKGFEIVGISVDSDAERLRKFVEDRKVPWIILQDVQPDKPDYEENSDRYGVMGIPTMILVGPDGNVITTSARGHALNKELEKIYGPVEEPKVEEGDPVEEDGGEEKAEA